MVHIIYFCRKSPLFGAARRSQFLCMHICAHKLFNHGVPSLYVSGSREVTNITHMRIRVLIPHLPIIRDTTPLGYVYAVIV